MHEVLAFLQQGADASRFGLSFVAVFALVVFGLASIRFTASSSAGRLFLLRFYGAVALVQLTLIVNFGGDANQPGRSSGPAVRLIVSGASGPSVFAYGRRRL